MKRSIFIILALIVGVIPDPGNAEKKPMPVHSQVLTKVRHLLQHVRDGGAHVVTLSSTAP